MRVNDYEVTFKVTTYADMFQRKAVRAIEKETGELYGDVTINIPQYSLDEGESFLSNNSSELINAMVENNYLKIVDEIKVNMGIYKIGKFTKKFVDEFEGDEESIMDSTSRHISNRMEDDGIRLQIESEKKKRNLRKGVDERSR